MARNVPLLLDHGFVATARSSWPAIRTQAALQSLEWSYRVLSALAIADTSLPTYFDFQDGLATGLVVYHNDITKLKPHRLIGADASIDGELYIVMQLFAFPFEPLLPGLMRALVRRLIKLLILLWREPRPVRGFARGLVGF